MNLCEIFNFRELENRALRADVELSGREREGE
jgi:hypothetical protein